MPFHLRAMNPHYVTDHHRRREPVPRGREEVAGDGVVGFRTGLVKEAH